MGLDFECICTLLTGLLEFASVSKERPRPAMPRSHQRGMSTFARDLWQPWDPGAPHGLSGPQGNAFSSGTCENHNAVTYYLFFYGSACGWDSDSGTRLQSFKAMLRVPALWHNSFFAFLNMLGPNNGKCTRRVEKKELQP